MKFSPKIGCLLFVIIFVVSACQNNKINILSVQHFAPSPSPNPNSPISDFDFGYFKYPWVYQNEPNTDFFELKNGVQEKTENQDGAAIQNIEYGDVTNDDEEDAVINIYPDTGENCSCNMVYTYAYNKGKPKLLWAFGTGDRAEGGLKKVYSENGELIVELFGDDKFEHDKWSFNTAKDKFNGLCCPTTYTKFHFKWNGEKFIVDGKPELFDYDWKNKKNNR